jgi:galactose mutarotase-like enzyme
MKPHFCVSKLLRFTLPALLPVLLAAPSLAAGQTQCTAPAQPVTEIGGEKIVTLTRTAISTTRPEFTSITILPGRGMQVLQITANLPGKGVIDVLHSPDLAAAAQSLDQRDDAIGDMSYHFGAPLLIPYPNRVRGTLSADGKTITTAWQGHTLVLPANNGSSRPGSERTAIHGLVTKIKTDDIRIQKTPGGEQVTGVIHAGDFGGYWLSKTDLAVTITLTAESVDASIVAHNVGSETEPIGIAWHPYFNLPSGDRAQARVRVPADLLTEVDNYENTFPTGKLLPVDGTRFDLRAPGGVALADNFFDNNWSHLDWKGGAATVQIIDPAAHYGLDIEGLSPRIKTIQIYSPVNAKFVAVEHQYNFADPFGKEWDSKDNGMVILKPGQSTTWRVRVHVFTP